MPHFGSINVICFMLYSCYTVVSLVKHQKRLASFYSFRSHEISLAWVYLLPACFALLTLANVANEALMTRQQSVSAETLHLASYLFFVVLLCFFGIRQKIIFKAEDVGAGREAISSESKPAPASENKPAAEPSHPIEAEQTEKSAPISDEAVMQLTAQVVAHMEQAKPYLDPSFSVYELAKSLGVPRRVLSYALKKGLAKNFFQFVNEYRIQEVQHRFQQEESKSGSILEVALDSGFNSKSSFNSLFKQHCQQTPSQYRNMIHAQRAANTHEAAGAL